MRIIQYLVCVILLAFLYDCKSPSNNEDSEPIITITTEVDLAGGSLLRSEGNRDVMIFLGESSQDSARVDPYIERFLFFGFDIIYPVNQPQSDSTRSDFVRSSIKFLLKKGYRKDKIVVYSKGESCYASCIALKDQEIRGLILESVTTLKIDFSLDNINSMKGKILIIQGDRDDNWDKSIQLYKQITNVQKRIFILPRISKDDIYYDSEFKELAEFFLTDNRFKHFDRSFKP